MPQGPGVKAGYWPERPGHRQELPLDGCKFPGLDVVFFKGEADAFEQEESAYHPA